MNRWERSTFVALTVVLLFQVLIYARRPTASGIAVEEPTTRTGQKVSAVKGRLHGREVQISLEHPGGRPTVVPAFTSRCRWCDSVAPIWRDWLSKPHGLEVLALTRDSEEEADAYKGKNGWTVTTLADVDIAGESIDRRLAARIP